MPAEKKSDYVVGYRRPPRETRFQKGQSGNAKGRPKGSKSLIALLGEELDQPIPVNENGRRKSITKRLAAAKQLVNKAVAGEYRYLKMLAELVKLSEQ